MFVVTLLALILAVPVSAQPSAQIAPRSFPVPDVTEWQPLGCRSVPFTDPVLLPRTAFRRAHADLESTDEVELAYAPVFERQWIVEPSLYQVTTPAFESAGNLYMTPLLPHEPILLIRRRAPAVSSCRSKRATEGAVILRDPETGMEVVYINRYERMPAVRTDGTTMWNVPTGLGAQMADAAERAVTEGNLEAAVGRRMRRLAAKLGEAPGSPSMVATRRVHGSSRYHDRAARLLGRACHLLSSFEQGKQPRTVRYSVGRRL